MWGVPHVSCLMSAWGSISRGLFWTSISALRRCVVWLLLSSDVMPRMKRLCTNIEASNRSKSRLCSLEGVFGAFMIRVALEEAALISDKVDADLIKGWW